MIQDPSPTDDSELEKFCNWLFDEGHEINSLSFEEMKGIYLSGRLKVARKRIKEKIDAGADIKADLANLHEWERIWLGS